MTKQQMIKFDIFCLYPKTSRDIGYVLTLKEINGNREILLDVDMVQAHNIELAIDRSDFIPRIYKNFSDFISSVGYKIYENILILKDKEIVAKLLLKNIEKHEVELIMPPADAVMLWSLTGVGLSVSEKTLDEITKVPNISQNICFEGDNLENNLLICSTDILQQMLSEAINLENFKQADLIYKEIVRRNK